MSRAALATAVRDLLRDTPANGGIGLKVTECDLAPFGGKPPPMTGKYFAGVYTGGRQNTTPAAGLDETYGCVVVLTWKLGAVPFDRIGQEFVKVSAGFDALSDSIRLCLARDVKTGCVQSRANAVIGYDPTATPAPTGPRGFTTALLWLGDDDPQPVGPEWFHAKPGSGAAGVVQRLRFGGMRRVQSFWDEDNDGGSVT